MVSAVFERAALARGRRNAAGRYDAPRHFVLAWLQSYIMGFRRAPGRTSTGPPKARKMLCGFMGAGDISGEAYGRVEEGRGSLGRDVLSPLPRRPRQVHLLVASLPVQAFLDSGSRPISYPAGSNSEWTRPKPGKKAQEAAACVRRRGARFEFTLVGLHKI